MADGSTRVVLAALAGNLAIAVTKVVAFAFTGSSAMLTEAIHSLVDTGDQVLLLVGQKRAARPPDETHPLGYGMETYFWSFIVSLMVFLLGGVVSIYEGVHKLQHPEPIRQAWINALVLGFSLVFEGASFTAAYREYRRIVRGRNIRLWGYLKGSKDPNIFAVLLEDGAAMTGLAIAAVGVGAASLLGWAWADAVASIMIGGLLMCVAFFLANESRSLIAGEAAAPDIVEKVRGIIDGDSRVQRTDELLSLHLGPKSIFFAITLRFREALSSAEVQQAAVDLGEKVKTADERIGFVFLRPSLSPGRGTASPTAG